MPEYLYKCHKCGTEFSVTLTLEKREETKLGQKIRCTRCESTEVKHIIEPFFVKTSKKS